MALFQDTGGDPRATASRSADMRVFYGAAGDAACGNPMGFAMHEASAAAILPATGSFFHRFFRIDFAPCVSTIERNTRRAKRTSAEQPIARFDHGERRLRGTRAAHKACPY